MPEYQLSKQVLKLIKNTEKYLSNITKSMTANKLKDPDLVQTKIAEYMLQFNELSEKDPKNATIYSNVMGKLEDYSKKIGDYQKEQIDELEAEIGISK